MTGLTPRGSGVRIPPRAASLARRRPETTDAGGRVVPRRRLHFRQPGSRRAAVAARRTARRAARVGTARAGARPLAAARAGVTAATAALGRTRARGSRRTRPEEGRADEGRAQHGQGQGDLHGSTPERVWNERNRDRPTPIQFRHTPRRMRTGRRGTSGASMRNASRSPWPASWASHGVEAGPRRSTAGPCGEAKGASSRGSHWHRHGDGWSSVACGPQDAAATQAGHVTGARSATSPTQAPQASARVEKGVAQASQRATATACNATKATQESSRAVVAPVRARMPCMGAFTYGGRLSIACVYRILRRPASVGPKNPERRRRRRPGGHVGTHHGVSWHVMAPPGMTGRQRRCRKATMPG